MNKALKAAKRVLPVFRQTVDGWAQGVMEADDGKKISCKRGCHHCCFNLVKATLAEGAAVAAHLVETGQFEKHRAQLEKTAKLADSFADAEGEDGSFRYLAAKEPCAFLKDGECSIYDLRPMSCRTYYVATSPDNCSPDRPGAEVGVVDARAAAGIFLNNLIQATHPHIPAFIGPFPSVVLAGKELVERSPGAFKRWAQKSELFTANVDMLSP